MIYAKLDVSFRDHERLAVAMHDAGWGVLGVYAWALMYLRGFESSTGILSDAVIAINMPRQKDTAKLIAALVGAGLWERREDAKGYYVRNYEKKNETKEEINERRAATNARVAKHRGGVGNAFHKNKSGALVPDSDSDSVFGSDLPEEGSGETNSVQAYQRAYESGIREGLGNGSGYGMPENQRGALHQAILAHSEKRKGEKLLAWISAAAADFAEDIKRRPDEQKFYSSFGPRGFLKWLNDQAAKVEARAIP